jgi:hypothetical protein
MSDLPAFPVDDVTLAAVEHALGGALSDADDEGPWLVGADYSLDRLLDFMAGATGRDPDEELIWEGDPDRPGWEGAQIVYDTRPHYHQHDIIRALIAEVRRLREASA